MTDKLTYKFQRLEIYQLSLQYVDLIYGLTDKLPKSEDFNLKSQANRAATSVVLNIAEGSTSQSDAEQARFLGMAVRSLLETVACQDLMLQRKYIQETDLYSVHELGTKIFAKTQAMRRSLRQVEREVMRSSVAGRQS